MPAGFPSLALDVHNVTLMYNILLCFFVYQQPTFLHSVFSCHELSSPQQSSSRSGRRKVWSGGKRTQELRGREPKRSSECRARKHSRVTTESHGRQRGKSTAIKHMVGWGVVGSQLTGVSIPLKRGFLRSRRKIINTLVVAMPANGSSVLSVSLSLSLTVSCQHSWP